MKKTFLLIQTLIKNPKDFLNRLNIKIEVFIDKLKNKKTDYSETSPKTAIEKIQKKLKIKNNFLAEKELKQIKKQVLGKYSYIKNTLKKESQYKGNIRLGEFCYFLCRAIKPKIVLETGVDYGISSAFILKALEKNKFGELHSIDLPPLRKNADKFTGILIPKKIKKRWKLHKGLSAKVLPKLIKQIKQVNIFIHDSLHTYKNMKKEFLLINPKLGKKFAVIFDDIELNSAFKEIFSNKKGLSLAIPKEKKRSLIGVFINN